MRKIKRFIIVVLIVIVSWYSCLGIAWFYLPLGGCRYPLRQVNEAQLVGTWHREVRKKGSQPPPSWEEYISEREIPKAQDIDEVYILGADGRYTQTLSLDGPQIHVYKGHWDFEGDSFDSPRIRVYDAAYFGMNRYVDPNTPATLRVQNAHLFPDWGERKSEWRAAYPIEYPDDGYLAMFPMVCGGEIKLVGLSGDLISREAKYAVIGKTIFSKK